MRLIQQRITELGLTAYHTHDSRGCWSPGFPDLVIAGPGGVIFAEVKSIRGRLTESQWAWGDRLLRAGADWQVWRPPAWPHEIDRQLKRLAQIGPRNSPS